MTIKQKIISNSLMSLALALGATFILYSTTNLATPFGLWTPVLTNQFDQFGVFGYTNIYNPAQRQQFYRFSVP